MAYGPLALSRRHVLGEHYLRCEAIESVPVYLNDIGGEVLGHVDESMGKYADAFLFHLTEETCKKLSAGHYTYSFEFEKADTGSPAAGRRSRLLAVILTARKGYARPLPKRGDAAAASAADVSTDGPDAGEQ